MTTATKPRAPTGAVREEILAFVSEQPQETAQVTSGAVRQFIVRQVVPRLQDKYGIGTPSSVEVAIGVAINEEGLLHQIDRRTIRLTPAGREVLNEYRSLDEPDDNDDDAEAAEAAESDAEADVVPDEGDTAEAADEPADEPTEAPEPDGEPDPEDEDVATAFDPEAVAAALLQRVIERALAEYQAPDPQEVADLTKALDRQREAREREAEDRAKAQQALEQARQAVGRLRDDRQKAERLVRQRESELEALRGELAQSKKAHGEANAEIGRLRARVDSLQDQQRQARQHPAFSREQQAQLERIMRELPTGR